MNIKVFKIKNEKVQKIWLIVLFALITAISLIVISFFTVFRKSSKIPFDKMDIFNYSSYYAKYNVVVYSNKNQNSYSIEEYCTRDSGENKFRFNILSEENNYSYIINNNSFYIKSDSQISSFRGDNYINSNTNMLSLATFIDIYTKVDKIINQNKLGEISNTRLEVKEIDEKISYNISFDKKLKDEDNILANEIQLATDMKVSKFELILDMNTKNPIEYIVYFDSGNSYIDVTYNEVKINEKIDEKVFSF